MRRLILFLSAGKSLDWWEREGVFSREILVYRELLQSGIFDRIAIFTYDAADGALLARMQAADPCLSGLELLAPASGKGGKFWSLCGVWRHRRTIRAAQAIKTNQISGAEAAVFASWLTGTPLVLRMGYILSRRFALNGQVLKAAIARGVEYMGSRRARAIIVTSSDAARHFSRNAAIASKVALLPSYVDVDTFTAKQSYDFNAPAVAVSRMRPQKNLAELLKGCALAGIDLVLVGKGQQEADLRALADTLPNNTEFAGTMDNVALASLLNRHTLFLLPSLHEGLPKALIEAMATGMICIASNIPGTTDLIDDGVTGYLIDGFSAKNIAAAIGRARAEADSAVGARARAKIEAQFGLVRYTAAEAAIYQSLR